MQGGPRIDCGRAPALRHVALVLGVALALGACGPTAPSVGPTSIASSPATPVPTAAAPSSAASGPLSEALSDAVDVDDILADLARLQAIADEHGGNRATGSAGHAASVDFVADELRRAGFVVELQANMLPAFFQDAPSIIEIGAGGPPALEDVRDFKAMLFSAAGDVTAPVFALGFDPAAMPGDRGGVGCRPEDWAAVPAGVIVLAQPGPCRRADMVALAQAAGVLAVVTTYADWPRDQVRRPVLNPDITIPVLGATHAVGLALADAAATGAQVHLVTHTRVERVSTVNVIAETPGGDPANIVMLGGHLDSVIDGPGINDNGSGTMTVLEIAREVAALARATPAGRVPWKVRVAFWTGEEAGIMGSAAYAKALGTMRDGPIRAYLNFDMLGSPNGLRVVYDGSVTSRPPESTKIQGLFTGALEAAGLTWQTEAVGAASDHWPLEQAGIPIGGLFSGASEPKSPEQANLFGGTPGTAADPCYHLACDTVANVDPTLLEQLARAAAWVVGALAAGEAVPAPS